MSTTCSRNTARREGFLKLSVAFATIGAAWALAAAEMATSDALAHRWSFTGNVKDSVTGVAAKSIGKPSLSATALVLPGGKHEAGHLDLGRNILPSDGANVTIEIWATLRSVHFWARIFDYGSDDKNYFTMAWSESSKPDTDSIEEVRTATW